VRELRRFFQDKKHFIEVPTQSRVSILAACENPKSITQYTIGGNVYPLPQTGQMWLEYELLKNPQWPGVFCISTSYRNESNPIAGRHDLVFPMFEFEAAGTFEDLKRLEAELLHHLGFKVPISVNYTDMAHRYDTQMLEDVHEVALAQEYGPSISLELFPEYTHPFWNMQPAEDNVYKKIDILLYGMETIGSAERSCDKEHMRHRFLTIEHGEYAQLLFNKFGKEAVLAELEAFFSLDMIPRYGGGIGLTRLARAMEKAELFAQAPESYGIRPAQSIPYMSL
jgi:aspartyl/asparaginyl-tRNA synthetase